MTNIPIKVVITEKQLKHLVSSILNEQMRTSNLTKRVLFINLNEKRVKTIGVNNNLLYNKQTMENHKKDPPNPMYLKLDELIPTHEYNTKQEDKFLKQFLDETKVDFNEEDEIHMSITQFFHLVNIIVSDYERYRLDNLFKSEDEIIDSK